MGAGVLTAAVLGLGVALASAPSAPVAPGVSVVPVQDDGSIEVPEGTTPLGGDSAVSEPVTTEPVTDDALVGDLPPGCAATAVGTGGSGGLGNGRGETREAAREAALQQCRDDGGENCEISSIACNPDG